MARSQLLYKASANTGEMPNLEHLNLKKCGNLKKVPSSLGYCKKLIYLSLHRCRGLESFPCVNVESLLYLNLEFCHSLEKFPEILGRMKPEGNTIIYYSAPSSSYIARIEFYVKPCSSSQQHCIGMLKGLVNLNVSFCSKLETLPGEIGNLGNLEKLDVSWCSKHESLTEEIGDLDNLEKLKASYTQISQPPFSIVQLNKLIFLSFERQCLEDRVYFVFPQVNGGLLSLHILDLSFCNIIDEGLLENIGSLSSLKELHLSGNNFDHLPGSIAQLVALKTLYLSSCERLTQLPEFLEQLDTISADWSNDLIECLIIASA
uniref:Resistance gene n=1 Tax=Solanum tuberosum TaxID=4113 RepID=M1D8F9_SOLTU